MRTLIRFLLLLTALPSLAPLLAAAALEGTPIVFAGSESEWKQDPSAPKVLGRNVTLLMQINRDEDAFQAVVVRTVLPEKYEASLDELSEGIRNSLENPAITVRADRETLFGDFPARRFDYEVNHEGRKTFNRSLIFVADGCSWTLAGKGPFDQAVQVTAMMDLFQPRSDTDNDKEEAAHGN